jgi:hypothetical protein
MMAGLSMADDSRDPGIPLTGMVNVDRNGQMALNGGVSPPADWVRAGGMGGFGGGSPTTCTEFEFQLNASLSQSSTNLPEPQNSAVLPNLI